jgi:hypothetical protein
MTNRISWRYGYDARPPHASHLPHPLVIPVGLVRLAGQLVSDMGGDANVTAAEHDIAVLSALCQDNEARLLAGEKVELDFHLASVNCLRRCLEAIGLQRRDRDPTCGPPRGCRPTGIILTSPVGIDGVDDIVKTA